MHPRAREVAEQGYTVLPAVYDADDREGTLIETLYDYDAYPALAAADALVRTGPTHTNVADVVVGLRVGS
mgnify:CR=1 FL=1